MSHLSGVICANPEPPCDIFGRLAVRCPEDNVHPIPRTIEQNYVTHGPQLYAGRSVEFGVGEGGIAFVRTLQHSSPAYTFC